MQETLLISHIQLNGLRYEITLRLIHIITLNCCSIADEFPEKKIFLFYIVWKDASFGLLHVLTCFKMFQYVFDGVLSQS